MYGLLGELKREKVDGEFASQHASRRHCERQAQHVPRANSVRRMRLLAFDAGVQPHLLLDWIRIARIRCTFLAPPRDLGQYPTWHSLVAAAYPRPVPHVAYSAAR
eukprot:1326093-Rhodomonas_salina.1